MKKRNTVKFNPQKLLSATLGFQITGILEILLTRELYDDKLHSLLCVNIAEMVNPTYMGTETVKNKNNSSYFTVNFTA